MKANTAFELTLQDNTLWVKADGVWTLSTAKAYVKAFRNTVQPVIGQPWALVLDIRSWQVSPAEVFSLLVDNTNWCYENNLQHVETICAENSLVMWQFAKATLAEKPAHLVSKLAADSASAKWALYQAGFIKTA